jgi:DNA-binding MarR family transcriptional regulator
VPDGLSIPNFRIMRSIVRGRTLVSGIARHHGVSQPSMSRSVDALVKQGFIERSREASDRRQAPLKLTKKGGLLMNKVIRSAENRLSRRIKNLDAASRKGLLTGLDSLEKFFSIQYDNGN